MNYTIKTLDNGKDFMVIYPGSDHKLQNNGNDNGKNTNAIRHTDKA